MAGARAAARWSLRRRRGLAAGAEAQSSKDGAQSLLRQQLDPDMGNEGLADYGRNLPCGIGAGTGGAQGARIAVVFFISVTKPTSLGQKCWTRLAINDRRRSAAEVRDHREGVL